MKQRIFREVKLFCMILQGWIHVLMHLSNHRMYSPQNEPDVSGGLRVAMIHACLLLSCSRCTTADSRDMVCILGDGGIWEFSILSAQFCYQSETLLIKKFINFIN